MAVCTLDDTDPDALEVFRKALLPYVDDLGGPRCRRAAFRERITATLVDYLRLHECVYMGTQRGPAVARFHFDRLIAGNIPSGMGRFVKDRKISRRSFDTYGVSIVVEPGSAGWKESFVDQLSGCARCIGMGLRIFNDMYVSDCFRNQMCFSLAWCRLAFDYHDGNGRLYGVLDVGFACTEVPKDGAPVRACL
jgi:hypothetical protein